jgi:peptide/nickel transport system substrate-binding protein
MRRCALHVPSIAAVLVAALPLGALAGKADNSLHVAQQTSIPNIDPYFNSLVPGRSLAEDVWDTLIYREPRTGALVGLLATDWRWIDERTLELDLRRGVAFHDGSPFDADDVVYTFRFVSDATSAGANPSLVQRIDTVEALDAYRVRMRFKRPFPAAPAFLASQRHVVHPSDYYARVGPQGMNAEPVGTGPWRVTKHELGKVIRLARNPSYFAGGPKSTPAIATAEIRFIPDPQTRVAEVVAGGVDIITDVARDQAQQLRGRQGLQIAASESVSYVYLRMNALPRTPAPPLRDVRVRQAIMHAIDRQSMAEHLVGEHSRVLDTDCMPSLFGCDSTGVRRYDYDPERARALLAEAGYANGLALDLHAFRDRNQAEALMGYLEVVGIRARLRFRQNAAVTAARRAGRVALVDTGNGSGGVYDFGVSVAPFYDLSVDDLSHDPEIGDLIMRGDTATDPAERTAAYNAALRLIAERAYVLPLYTLTRYYIMAEDLVFEPHDDDMLRLWAMAWR